ncbi:MAG: DUF1786 domain-containing protein [Deltaproteobacteria bacterium]|nr:DUF1786 domain-containing protein [Deltaproteobacteria bacterium]MBW1952438.1 DUF1786 domain-containing protein [Deltaproteobacteria bacterium]MBW1986682.1 DUF1786 domain-containing protein [Deltaproteobacteria bacterium]
MKPTLRLLAIDVGGGTQDILLWDADQPLENAVKLILPAPTQIIARRIQRLTAAGADLFLTGRLMGGGAVNRAIRGHLAQGLKVYARPEPALTVADNLDRVKALGLKLVDQPPQQAAAVTLGDVDLDAINRLLADFEVTPPNGYALAVQDHGFSPQLSNRRFRFQHWEAFLQQGGRLSDLAYSSPPTYLTRMAAGLEILPGALVMDTCTAGIRGALLDPQAQAHQENGLVVVNIGNAHTFAALVRKDRLWGLYEHHTRLLNPAKLADHLSRFQAGTLSNEEIYQDQGHGCAIAPDYLNGPAFRFTVITGPQRRLGEGFPAHFAAPLGDLMLTGCFGLVAAYLEFQGLNHIHGIRRL